MSCAPLPQPGQTDQPLDDVATWNLAIIEALAGGVHPMTAEPLDEESLFHDHNIRRALVAAKDALEAKNQRTARQAKLPKQTGQAWSNHEDDTLVARFESGLGFAELAELHGRTQGAIRSRLAKLGKLIPER